MLNLRELEEALDKALEKETKESLTEWLLSKRFPYIESFLGAGSLIAMEEKAYCAKVTATKGAYSWDETDWQLEDCCLEMAA